MLGEQTLAVHPVENNPTSFLNFQKYQLTCNSFQRNFKRSVQYRMYKGLDSADSALIAYLVDECRRLGTHPRRFDGDGPGRPSLPPRRPRHRQLQRCQGLQQTRGHGLSQNSSTQTTWLWSTGLVASSRRKSIPGSEPTSRPFLTLIGSSIRSLERQCRSWDMAWGRCLRVAHLLHCASTIGSRAYSTVGRGTELGRRELAPKS